MKPKFRPKHFDNWFSEKRQNWVLESWSYDSWPKKGSKYFQKTAFVTIFAVFSVRKPRLFKSVSPKTLRCGWCWKPTKTHLPNRQIWLFLRNETKPSFWSQNDRPETESLAPKFRREPNSGSTKHKCSRFRGQIPEIYQKNVCGEKI